MGQSMSSIGGKKQKGASGQRKDQPEREPGQKVRDMGGTTKTGKSKPDGGADHGPRSVR